MILEMTTWNITTVSIFFVLFFLPLSLFVYYILPANTRKSSLIIISGVFLLLVVPNQLPIILAVAAFTTIVARKIASIESSNARKIYLGIAIAANIAIWLVFGGVKSGSLPNILGAGIFPLLGIDLAITCYRTEKGNIPIFSSSFLYLLFFPRLYVGPLSSLDGFWETGISEAPAGINLLKGMEKYIRGSFQFVFLGLRLSSLFFRITMFKPQDVTKLSSWIMVVALIMGLFHTMSGFTLLSRGIGEMYGINLPKTFHNPHSAMGIDDYTGRFNSQLKKFFKKNMYEPMKKATQKPSIIMVATVVIGGIMGLWYGLNSAFLLFGLFLGAFVVLEKTVLKNFVKKKDITVKLYTVFVVGIGYAILALGYTGWSVDVLKALFLPTAVSFSNNAIMYLITSNLLILIMGAVLATSIPKALENWVENIPQNVSIAIRLVFHSVLLLVLIALMV